MICREMLKRAEALRDRLTPPPINEKQIESIMVAAERGADIESLLNVYGITLNQLHAAIMERIAELDREKREAILKLIRHRQSKVQ